MGRARGTIAYLDVLDVGLGEWVRAPYLAGYSSPYICWAR
jgi:hypothetical protein